MLADVQKDFARGLDFGARESGERMVKMVGTLVGKGGEGVYAIISISVIS